MKWSEISVNGKLLSGGFVIPFPHLPNPLYITQRGG